MNIEEILKAAVEKKNRDQLNRDRAGLLDTIGKDITNALTPVLEEIAKKSSVSAEGVVEAVEAGIERGFKKLKFPEPNITVQVPDVYVPEIRIPQIPAPQVNYTPPAIKIPEIKMPDEMNIKGWVQLMGVDLNNPLPVQLRDANGKPVNLLENLTTLIGGGGSGHKIVKISDIGNSAWGSLLTGDGRLKVEQPSGASGLTDTELRASSVPVAQVSGANWSVSVVDTMNINQVSGAVWSMSVNDVFRTTVASNLINSDDRLRVSVETGGSGLTDTELRAASVPVAQASGAQWSVEASQVNSWLVSQVSGANFSVEVATQPITFDVKQVSGSVDSVVVNSFLTSLEVKQVSGFSDSVSVTGMPATTVVMGDIYSDVADVDSAPIKVGGIARTANPAAVGAGDRVSATYDDLGRQLVRPVQIRDLIQTAYVAKTTGSTFGTETTLLASAAGVFSDLIYVMGTNDSDAALTCDFRSGTANGIVFSLRIPANGTAGVSLAVPIPQDVATATWTLDLPDVTGTNVSISALFSLEV